MLFFFYLLEVANKNIKEIDNDVYVNYDYHRFLPMAFFLYCSFIYFYFSYEKYKVSLFTTLA